MTTKTTLKIKPSKLASFDAIKKAGNFNWGIYIHLEENKTCKTAILSKPTNTKEEDLVLYYEGSDQRIPGGSDIYAYFAEKGYEVVPQAHASLLVNAMKELTEEKLTEMGIPTYVDIVLPTTEDSLLPDYVDRCFLKACRNDGGRQLTLECFDGGWGDDFAFLLRKSSKTPSTETLEPSDALLFAVETCKKAGYLVFEPK